MCQQCGIVGNIGHPEITNKGIGRSGVTPPVKKVASTFPLFHLTKSMASSLATRAATQAVRTASRRAPRVLANAALKPVQTVSYSLLAQATAGCCTQRATVQVSFVLLESYVFA